MASFLGSIKSMVEYATRPPAPPVDRTVQDPIEPEKLDNLIKEAKEVHYKMDKPADFNVAVVGAKGAGKSSLINGVRNRRDDEPGSAPVGVSNSEAKAYRGAIIESLVLWELPGAGVGHPALTYFADKKLYAFDLIIIVSDRFQRIDFEVAKAALRLNRPRFIFVRTKADLAVKRILERESANQGKTIHHVAEAMKILHEEVNRSFREGLRLAGLADKWDAMTLFVVSSKEFMNPHVYVADHHVVEEEEEEEGGQKMDEDALVYYVTNLVRNRVRRSRSSRKLQPAPSLV